MPKHRSWSDSELKLAVAGSYSVRSVLIKLELIPAGGNYEQIKTRIALLNINTEHFTGKLWNKGKKYTLKNSLNLNEILVENSNIQSFKLKNKLFALGLLFPKCEICGWCQEASDGRVPVELDHKNGNKYDNRIENLRILCPNCHSLQLTHRGKNKKVGLTNRK